MWNVWSSLAHEYVWSVLREFSSSQSFWLHCGKDDAEVDLKVTVLALGMSTKAWVSMTPAWPRPEGTPMRSAPSHSWGCSGEVFLELSVERI